MSFRHAIDARLQVPPLAHQVGHRERLIGEAHIHDARRVALGRRQVDEPTLTEQDHALIGTENELLDERAQRAPALAGHLLQAPQC